MKVVRGSSVIAAFVVATAIAAPGAQAHRGSAGTSSPRFSFARSGTPGILTSLQRRAMRGALPSDPVALRALKAAAAANLSGGPEGGPARRPAPSPNPTIQATWQGIAAAGTSSPSDSTGAIGPSSYIENVNSIATIYDRTGAPLATSALDTWWGEGGSSAFDPQIMWDATTNRFYYTGDAVFSGSDNRLSFGFSKTANPTTLTSADWCNYEFGFGSQFPDYPKLGDSRDFSLIGVNVFSGNSFVGSKILAVSKPGAGATCPLATTFKFKVRGPLTANGAPQFTPVPANEIDGNGTGYVITRSSGLPGSRIGVFTVTKAADSSPIIDTTGTSVTVPSYAVPPAAPQPGTSDTLDTSDARFTQAVAAVDPIHGNKLRLWTQHAVAGGAGSVERWYEINPGAASLVQAGTVKNSSLFIFDGAISPDRVVNGGAKAYGGNMVMSFVTASTTSFPTIQMVSKRADLGVSSMVLVHASPGADTDFTCATPPCRWGDYAAATPDPAASTTGKTGIVWLTSMWTLTGSSSTTSWQTWNWSAKP